MTRFARAKGSKASNEKVPSDGTPWTVMKEQLEESKQQKEESKKKREAEAERQKNYKKFLDDQKVQKRKSTWCEFPELEKKKSRTDEAYNMKIKSKDKKLNKQKNKINSDNVSDTFMNIETKNINQNLEVKTKNEKKNQVNSALADHSKLVKLETKMSEAVNTKQDTGKNNKIKSRKDKIANGKPLRRKPDTDNSFQLIINGKQVELVRFDGFPVIKKDAERLEELKNNMIKKGIPKSEVQRTIKLERRRAEKALARLKRDVCYNCRKGGHNLSDCPDLKTKIPGVDAADGLCFKCGSTEHKSFDCKVHKDQGFRFATCFICKEQGHIARQCPDNPKGLYPNGGGCKLCGDVTHLRKDCPTVSNKPEETKSIRLETLHTSDTLEGINEETQPQPSEPKSKKPKKIKF